jgi:hypothetical protein
MENKRKSDKKAAVVEEMQPVAEGSTRKILALASLIIGGLAFIGFVVLSSLTISLAQTVQIVAVLGVSLLSIGGVVFAIFALLEGDKGPQVLKWMGVAVIGLVISFIVVNRFITPLISVLGFLFKK